jgi:hypothetical protein
MEPLVTSIITALVAGAAAKTAEVASQAVQDAYDGLKGLIIRKLGKSGAVQSIEDDPDSDAAHTALAEQVVKNRLDADPELKASADRLEAALKQAKEAAVPGAGEIDIGTVRGKINATVENLVAAGRIHLSSVIAETGDAKVSGLTAGLGVTPPRPGPPAKNV